MSGNDAMPEKESIDSRPEEHGIAELHGAILRERVDPREGYEPVPMWFTALCGALVFWAGWYMSEYGGGGNPNVLDPRPAARFPASGAAQGPVDPKELGQKLFTAHCVSCHQQSGAGIPGQYPPLVGSPWVVGEPAVTKRILLHGLDGPITVEGATYNGNMPAFGAKLKDAHIAAVLTYIRSAWGNEASAVAPESVAATRAATAGRTKSWSESELKTVTKEDEGSGEKEPPGDK
jgi:mono/diheme cytochrome c family protein